MIIDHIGTHGSLDVSSIRAGCGSEWATRSTAAQGRTVLFESHELFGAEGFVVNLTGAVNEVLQVGACEEVAKVHEFTVSFILHVDDAPAIYACSHLFPIDRHGLL